VIQEQWPFIQAIFDYEAPSMHRLGIALLGDAAVVVRPHTAMGVSKAAGDALALRDALWKEHSLESALHRYGETRLAVGRQLRSTDGSLEDGLCKAQHRLIDLRTASACLEAKCSAKCGPRVT
jgi:2-polyprenyl-6-methoxyphenol hydroxylase-like FAD-dependent oxidoreductase